MTIIYHALANPGAETGVTSGWTLNRGSFDVRTGTPPAYSGGYYFIMGNTAGVSEVYQSTFPSSDGVADADADNYRALYTMRGRASGFDGSQDPYLPKISFRSGSGTLLGSFQGERRTTNQVWEEFIIEAIYPPLTRQVDVHLVGHRTDGTNLDAYYDVISAYTTIVYSSSFVNSAIALTNPADVGSTIGWDFITGSFFSSSISPFLGSYKFNPASIAAAEMSQLYDVTSLAINSVCRANSYVDVVFSWRAEISDDQDDTGMMYIIARDSSSNQLYVSSTPIQYYRPGLAADPNSLSFWRQVVQRMPLSDNVRYLDVRLKSTRLNGTQNNYAFDAISLWTVTGSGNPFTSGISPIRNYPSQILRFTPSVSQRRLPELFR